MKTSLFALLALCLSAVVHMPLQAHEFWIAPVTAPLTVGSTARLKLLVGEQFTGELVGWSKPQTAQLRLISKAGVKDISSQVPGTAVADLPITLSAAGVHLVAFESQSHFISLSADSFHAYLHEEGLDFIKARREAQGTAQKPGRERYRRFVKTLLDVGEPAAAGAAPVAQASAVDATHASRVGQQLELIPLANPFRLPAGNALAVQVLFEGQPLAGALLKAWYKTDGQSPSGQLLTIRATTGADGIATVNLPYAGPWMVSVVHMVAAVNVKDTEWDSLWGNLSFVLPGN